MKCAIWLLVAGPFLACGDQPEPSGRIEREPDRGRTILTVEQLPPMPPYPDARGGRLVVESAGDFDLNGAWEAHAGLCEEVGVIEIYAGPSGLRSAVLLRMPEGEPLGKYPVVAADADFPDAPAALIAVQGFAEPEAFGLQAFSGELEVTAFGERVSGRFTSTLREISVDMLTQYVGVFEGVSVEPLSARYCEALRDSTLAPSDTVADASTDGGQ